MGEIDIGTNTQAEHAVQCLGQMDTLSKRIMVVSENTQKISSIASQTEGSIKTGMTSMDALNEKSHSTAEITNVVIASIEELEVKSKSIGQIVSAINEIASETNLLSLNASIEAARAGEAGRGFAVVADQIGKLAADSAKSAVTTRELISKSLDEIENGNSIVENTMESISIVLANMEAFAGIAAGSAEASKKQVDLLKEVEAGIEKITIVVQNNSAAAEETSAVSQELSAQATGLEEMVERFVLKG